MGHWGRYSNVESFLFLLHLDATTHAVCLGQTASSMLQVMDDIFVVENCVPPKRLSNGRLLIYHSVLETVRLCNFQQALAVTTLYPCTRLLSIKTDCLTYKSAVPLAYPAKALVDIEAVIKGAVWHQEAVDTNCVIDLPFRPRHRTA